MDIRDDNIIKNLKMLTSIPFTPLQKERNGNSKREGHNNLSLSTDFNLLIERYASFLR